MFNKRKVFFGIKGMTVLEMTVSLAILAMIGVALSSLIVYSIRAWASGSSTTGASTASDVAIQKLIQDIREASSATVSSGQLVLTMPTLTTDVHGETYYDREGSTVTQRYYLSNEIIYRQIGDGTATVFARGISAIGFSVSGDVITISVTSSDQVGISKSSEVKTAHVVMRNHGD